MRCRRTACAARPTPAADGSMRAVRSTICWVIASSRLGALITRSRSCAKASRWASSSRSAFAAATITRVSRSRRCGGVSGTASSRIWRTLNACASVVLASVTALLNGAVSLSPNSSTAKVNSLSLVRTALSTSTTIDLDRSSSASTGTDASALGSDGSTRRAAAYSASRRLRRRRRVHHHSSSDQHDEDGQRDQQPDRGDAGAGRRSAAVQPVGRRDRRARPVVAAQCGFDLVAAQVVGRRVADSSDVGQQGRHRSDPWWRPPGWHPRCSKSLVRLVLSAQSTAPWP